MAIIIDPVTVDDMTPEDIESIAAIERRCYPMPWHESAYHTELTNICATYLVARVGGRVIGYAGMWVVMDEAHVTTIAVDPDYQGRKYGERLLLGLIERAIEEGANRSTLEVREGNRVARHLYEKYGFVDTAVRKCYYTDNQENAIVMWAEDLASREYGEKLAELRRRLVAHYDEHTRPGD